MNNHKLSRPVYLLICLIEECAEVIQRACKALRFGFKEVQPNQEHDNIRRLQMELNDLHAVIQLAQEAEIPLQHVIPGYRSEKEAKIERFYLYSVEQGCAEPLHEHIDPQNATLAFIKLRQKEAIEWMRDNDCSDLKNGPQYERWRKELIQWRDELLRRGLNPVL